jgi:hypothetical protein
MSNDLILRTLTSPYNDLTRGSVLSQADVDGNFIFLKGKTLNSGNFSGGTLTLSLLDNTIVNIPISGITNSDTYVTGGTYSNGTTIFRNNTGGTFTVSGFSSDQNNIIRVKQYSLTDIGVTSGSTDLQIRTALAVYIDGMVIPDDEIWYFQLTGYADTTSGQDTFITGGTYTAGTATFNNNTGGTFSVSGFNTGSTQDNIIRVKQYTLADIGVTSGSTDLQIRTALATYINGMIIPDDEIWYFQLTGFSDGPSSIQTIQQGANITVNNTDPLNPIISAQNVGASLLANVTDIISYSGSENSILVKDPIRGGTFLKYTGVNPVDNGFIFQDANSSKWIRQTDVDYMNIDWFGAVADNVTDNYSFILNTIASSITNLSVCKIYVPSNAGAYFVSTTIVLNQATEIFGDGVGSELRFGLHIAGLKFTYVNSRYSRLHDINLTGSIGSPATWNNSAHGIIIQDIIQCENVTVNQFEGSGYYAHNNIPTGNSSNSIFSNCLASQNRLHGFDFQGGDCNAMTLTKCNAITNGGVGFYDKSFLGNHYLYLHSASNSSPEVTWQRSLCSFSGVTYACITGGTLNIVPPNTANWQALVENWSGYTGVLAYNSGTTYQVGGAWVLQGAAQYGDMTGCYAEFDQPYSFADQRNVILNCSAEWRSPPALLSANSSSLYSLQPIYAGANPATSGKFSRIGLDGFSLGDAFAAEGMKISYNQSVKALAIGDITASSGPVLFWSEFTTAAMQGRTNYASAAGYAYGIMIATQSSRSNFTYLGMARTKPSLTGLDLGDMLLATNTIYFDEKPEVVLYKTSTGVGGTTVNRLLGMIEFEFTTNNAIATQVTADLYIPKAIKYDIDILATIANTDVWGQHKSLVFSNNGTALSLVSTIDSNVFKTSGLTGATLYGSIVGTSALIYVTGIAATTINWKVQVKRILI